MSDYYFWNVGTFLNMHWQILTPKLNVNDQFKLIYIGSGLRTLV